MATASHATTQASQSLFPMLPVEILLDIFHYLPLAGFYELAHSHRKFREVLQANAAFISNRQINAFYSEEAEITKADMKDGWLVPTDTSLIDCETCVHALGPRHCGRTRRGATYLSMTAPGPLFLNMLQDSEILISEDSCKLYAPYIRVTREGKGVPQTMRKELIWHHGVVEMVVVDDDMQGAIDGRWGCWYGDLRTFSWTCEFNCYDPPF